MAFRTICPACEAVYQLPTIPRTNRVRCKRCRHVFAVAGDPQQVTRGVQRADSDDEPEALQAKGPPAGRGVPLLVWLLGGGLLLALVVVVIVVVVVSGGGTNEQPPVVQGPQPGQKGRKKQGTPTPPRKVVDPPELKRPPEPPPVATQPEPELPPATVAGVQGPGPAKLPFWKVEVDPPKAPVGGPEAADRSIPLSAQARLLYPSTPSPFAALAYPKRTPYTVAVYDLRKMKEVGKIASPVPVVDDVLSPDGKEFAARMVRKDKTVVEVWSVGDEDKPSRVEVDPRPVYLTLLDFARSGRLVTAKVGLAGAHFQIWDAVTGQETKHFDAPLFAYKLEAFSPGRRYLAVADKKKIMVHDLVAGMQVGEIAHPTFAQGPPRGLAFSPDGKELAAYYEKGGAGILASWDVAAGTVACEHRWEKVGPGTLAQKSVLSQPPGLLWLDSRLGWLVLGEVLVEYKTGKHTVLLPAAVGDTTLGARRLLGPGHLLAASGPPGKQQLKALPMPAEQIAALVNAVRQDAVAAPLPPAKVATWAGVRLLGWLEGETPWQATPDPAPAARALPLPLIPLRCRQDQTEQILFSAPPTARVAILSMVMPSPPAPPGPGVVRVDHFELTSGKLLGGRALCPVPAKQKAKTIRGDLSPDGKLLLVQHPTDPRRLDVWSAPDGKHEAAWMPCATTTERGGKARWFAALDGGRALTLSEEGRLTLWQLPECRALYTLEGVNGAVALSPGRQHLALYSYAACQMLATADGSWRGRRLLPKGVPPGPALAAAFTPDGRALVARLGELNKSVLSRWDVAGGKLEDTIHADGGFPNDRLVVLSGRHALLGSRVFDWTLHAPVCQYRSMVPRFLDPTGLPDGKCWLAYDQAGIQNVLRVQSLPDSATRALLARIAAGQAEVVLKRGAAVAVNVPGGGPASFAQNATKRLTERLKQLEFVPAADAPVKVTVQVSEKANGSFQMFSTDGSKTSIQVPLTELATTVEMTDAAGKKIAAATATFVTRPPALGRVVFGDPSAQARGEPYDRCALWIGGVDLPAVVVRDGDRYRALPETMVFKTDGP